MTEQETAIQERAAEELAQSAREAAVVKLRASGMTFTAIGIELGIHETTAKRTFDRMLRAMPKAHVDDYRKLEVERLEWAIEVAQKVVRRTLAAGRTDMAMRGLDRFLAAEKALREVLGVDAPVRQEVLVLTDEMLEERKRELERERDERLRLVS